MSGAGAHRKPVVMPLQGYVEDGVELFARPSRMAKFHIKSFKLSRVTLVIHIV